MVTLIIIAALGFSIAMAKKQPKVSGALDLLVALLILFFEVVPGRAGTLDWIFMVLFFLMGFGLLFGKIPGAKEKESEEPPPAPSPPA